MTVSQWNEAQGRLTREQISEMLVAKDERNDSLTNQLKTADDKLTEAVDIIERIDRIATGEDNANDGEVLGVIHGLVIEGWRQHMALAVAV